MVHFAHPWFVAGGWALDLFVGAQSRPHADVDIAIFREDQIALCTALPSWSFVKVVNRQMRPWSPAEYLQPPVHELYASRGEDRLEFLLNERTSDAWVFRRDATITLPLRHLCGMSTQGVPYLAPEVVLLYKAKTPKLVDDADFGHVAPKLSAAARKWLASALARCHPGHRWHTVLAGSDVAVISNAQESQGASVYGS